MNENQSAALRISEKGLVADESIMTTQIIKLCPKLIIEGTRLTGKTDLALALNEHVWLNAGGVIQGLYGVYELTFNA